MDLVSRPTAAVLRAFRHVTGVGLPDVRPVFASIPKTGSQSVSRMLRNAYWGQPVLYLPDGDGPPRARALRERILRNTGAFSRYGVYRGFFDIPLARERVQNPFIFTFVRDPEDRLVSAYYYGQRKLGTKFSFDEWKPDDCNAMTLRLAGSADPDAAIEVLSRMDFVGVTERIASDMPRLLARLGRPSVSVAAKNINRERPAWDDVPGRIKSMLAELTQADRKVYEWALKQG